MMINKIKYLFFLLLVSFSSLAQSQRETGLGASFSLDLEKGLSRFLSLSMNEEIRLIDNRTGFDRTVTSVGLDYSLFNKKIKFGVYYAFIYLYNNDYLFEPRHRYYFNLSYKESVEQFTFSWRGRLQGTYRDENRGEYKINPKYILKNKFEVEYALWGLPWKPYLSCDFSTAMNDPMGNDLNRIRLQGGTNWRLNRTTYLEFFVRYDDYFTKGDDNALSIGACYKIKW
jgi:hypothetical protein